MEGVQIIPLQDWHFLVFEGGLVFFGFFFGVALLVSYVANYGLNGLSPATGRHTYIGGTW